MTLRQAAPFLCILLSVLPQNAAAENLVLAVGDWPPYFSQSMKENGVFAHIVKEAFARKGTSVTYEFYPWARALAMAQEGTRIVASPGWVMTDERSRSFLFSDPVITSKEVLFYLKAKPVSFNTVADLAGLRVGAAIGYTYGAEFDAAEKAGRFVVERTQTDEQNLKKLLVGRLDAVALNRAVGFELLTQFTPAERRQITATDRSLSEKESRMAVSKAYRGAEELLKTFNAGLAEMVRDGTVKRFLDAAEKGEYGP